MNTPSDSVVAEWLRVGVPAVALAVSLMSLWFTRKLWVQSNRPIVTAAIRTRSAGNEATTYELVIVNSGSRPAATVRLTATNESINQAIDSAALVSEEMARLVKQVRRCFSLEAVIPVLLNGQALSNSFGYTGPAGGQGTFWKSGSSIPITITYVDLDGRSYDTQLTLVIRDTLGFAGSYWTKAK